MYKLDLTPKEYFIKNVSENHKIFIYGQDIIILDYNEKTGKWKSSIFQKNHQDEYYDGKDSLYELLAWTIRLIDEDGVFCPNYIKEITHSDYKVRELEIEY